MKRSWWRLQHNNMPNNSDSEVNPSLPLSQSASHSYQQGSIRMTLEKAELWKSFHRMGTEMIITKHGRRMFPHCSISLSGLQPFTNYVIMVDMVPVDGFKYKWKKERWEVVGKAEPQPPCRTYLHPDSPAAGGHWMKQALSFLKLKLTNNTLDQHGHIILHSMHRYYPRFHVIQADSPYTVCWAAVQTFSFPETVYTAVTAYQNPKITKLKIDHNPFAKGFRDGGTHSHSKRCLSSKSPPAKRPPCGGKNFDHSPGLQRMPCTSQLKPAQKNKTSTLQAQNEGHILSWVPEQESTESLHSESMEMQEYDYSCEEQMVPASSAYQPYRSVDYGRHSFPSGDLDSLQTLVRPAPHPPATSDQVTHTAEWSQHPLFSYSCW